MKSELIFTGTRLILNEQQEAFEFQIRLAIKHDLPIVIHCRDAFDEIFEILDKENCPKLRGVFHCFTGTLEQAKRAIDLGFCPWNRRSSYF